MTQMKIHTPKRNERAGYKVDVSRGQRIGRVSSEWFHRPADERYLSLTDLRNSVKSRSERSETRIVESQLIRVEAGRDDPERLCLRPARQDNNLIGPDRLAPPGENLLRAHVMRPRHRRDVRARRQRLFQNPRFRFRRPAPAQQGRALLEPICYRLDDCKCFKSGLGCRLQSNLPRRIITRVSSPFLPFSETGGRVGAYGILSSIHRWRTFSRPRFPRWPGRISPV